MRAPINKHRQNGACRPHAAGVGFHPIRIAVLAMLAQGWHVQVGAQPYFNYDGTQASDYAAAAASWVNAGEFTSDWGLKAMNAQYAYALGYSGKGVNVGAVDSGLRLTHQEFADTSTRTVSALAVSGTYLSAGSQSTPRYNYPLLQDGRIWSAGDAFGVAGAYDPAFNDNHGNHVSGTIAAAKNGLGMMGVAWGANYYITNTHGTDGSIYGANMDYNYFKAAYGNLAAAGVRVINSSWGSPYEMDNYGSVGGVVTAYRVMQSAGKKTWLDAVADVSLETGVIQVFAAGNAGAANVNVRSAVPYFRPELESSWVTVSGLTPALATQYNKCGLAKYWCVAAPSSGINSLDGVKGDAAYRSSSGTSMAAPHVTGALGVLMERYPTLGNEAVRTILLTTSRQPNGAAGVATDVPNTTFGWGVPDLQIAMNGPGQLLSRFDAHLGTGVNDSWSNAISDKALQARKVEDKAEIDTWNASGKQAMQAKIDALPTNDAMLAGIANAKLLLEDAIAKNVAQGYSSTARKAALSAVKADAIGRVLLAMYEDTHPAWTIFSETSLPTDFDEFVGGLNDAQLAAAALAAAKAQLQTELNLSQARIDSLAAKTDADYVGTLVKTGSGSLTLTGANSYSGGTELKEGTLGVGHATALGTGKLSMANAAVLQAASDGLNVANAVSVSGTGIVDTQAHTLTLSGAVTDGESAGGLLKTGSGVLTLSGANTYSGSTGVAQGTLRAGSSTGFSPNSSFVVETAGQLDLGGFDQRIGALAGGGKVALGAARLSIGSNNASGSFSGQISGSGSLIKTGSGVLGLTGANSYQGGTELKTGRIDLGHSSALGTGDLAMDDGTTLGFTADRLNVANDIQLTGTQDPIIDTGPFTETLSGVISGTGFLTKSGSGTLITTGVNSYSGATVVAEGRLQAGAVNSFSPISAVSVNAGATLDLAGYSQRLASVRNAGTVSLAGGAPGTTLTVTGPWIGLNGNLRMSAVREASGNVVADRLLLSGSDAKASGNTVVQLAQTGLLGAPTTGEGIELVGTEGGASIESNAFSLAGGHLDAGAYEYQLRNTRKGAYLSSNLGGVPSYRAEASLLAALPSQLRRADLGLLGNLRLRMGDEDGQRSADAATGGSRRAWGRIVSTGVKLQQDGTVSPHSDGQLNGFQAGTDLLALPNWRAGVYVGQLDGDIDVKGFAGGIASRAVGSNDLRSRYLGVYGTYMADSGLYVDAVLQAGQHRYSVQPILSRASNGKASSLLASVEVGQPFALGSSGWTLEPQVQLIHARQDMDDINLSGTQVQMHADSSWIGRVGLRVKGEFSTGMGTLQPYARVNLSRSGSGTDQARFVNAMAVTDINSTLGGSGIEAAGGFTMALGRTTALYGEVGKLWASGGHVKSRSSVNGSVGLRMRW